MSYMHPRHRMLIDLLKGLWSFVSGKWWRNRQRWRKTYD
jgi:hypothetical protein